MTGDRGYHEQMIGEVHAESGLSALAIVADELMETIRNAHLALEDCVDGRGGTAALVRAGELYFNGAGLKLDSYADLPAGMRAAIEARAPLYREPPPVDDQRPNETSWTYFKKQMDAAQKK